MTIKRNKDTYQYLSNNREYKTWLTELKLKVRNTQLKAVVKVNTEMLSFYWGLGADIVAKQVNAKWGDGFLSQLSKDLINEFPQMKGFSRTNLMYIKKWYLFYSQGNKIIQLPVLQLSKDAIVPQAVGQLRQEAIAQITQIPWGHNREIITNCKNVNEALFYVQNTIKYNWSRSVLVHQMESGLYKRDGKSVNNFALTLPKPQSDLAEQTLKDPYIFDFISMTKEYNELDLEKALVTHVTQFLLELGTGFSYVGRQVPVSVGESDFYIDLLFYHLKLHCYVVIELKTAAFQPEFAGKLNFYLKAVDMKFRTEQDKPTIGILICKKKDKIVAEYALSDINKPIGISVYKLMHSLPKKFMPSLPTIEQIEKELSDGGMK
jgi:predicted nuclease of restriction endonuclease-like (RecB) superfamily